MADDLPSARGEGEPCWGPPSTAGTAVGEDDKVDDEDPADNEDSSVDSHLADKVQQGELRGTASDHPSTASSSHSVRGRINHAANAVREVADAIQIAGQMSLSKFDPPQVAVLLEDPPRRRLGRVIAADHVVLEATVDYLGQPRRLFILNVPKHLANPSPFVILTSAQQVTQLVTMLDAAHPGWEGEPPLAWPLHNAFVTRAVVAREFLSPKSRKNWGAREAGLRHLMRLLSVEVPPEDGDLLNFVRDHFGAAVAFAVSWNHVYPQMLWALAPPCVALWALELAGAGETKLRIAGQATVLVWGAACAVYARWRFMSGYEPDEVMFAGDSRVALQPASSRTRLTRWLVFLFLALPSLLLFCAVVWITFSAVTQLIVKVIYDWGDCLNPDLNGGLGADSCRPPTRTEECCRDAEKKHGIWGWAAEVACDILLVIMVEIFFPISDLFANWIADLRNHKYMIEREVFVMIISLSLASFEATLFRVCFALLVAPQWLAPSEQPTCFEWQSTWCRVQTDLETVRRRWVFEKLLKGPFCVAPFISILMKFVVPQVAAALAGASHRCCRKGIGGIAMAPLRGLSRLLELIFTYDGGHVGCLRFVGRGWPFKGLQLVSRADAQAEAGGGIRAGAKTSPVPQRASAGSWGSGASDARQDAKSLACAKAALREFVRKPFEVDDEMLEIQLNFLSMLMFAPFMPLGVVFTLVARCLEARTDLGKMAQVRRMAMPQDDEAMRRNHGAFMFAAVFAAAGWHVGLHFVTYNDEFWTWGVWRYAVLAATVVALLSQPALLMARNEMYGVSPSGLARGWLCACVFKDRPSEGD